MATWIAAIVLAGLIGWAVDQIRREMRAARQAAQRAQSLTILSLFSPALAAVQDDPKALLVWQPLAAAVRKLFPEECASLDSAMGSSFPFGAEVISTAHARWTADWLAWEGAHDATYKVKIAVARRDADSVDGRARLDALEREKLDLYQRRYEEYIRVARALQKLTG